jgi:pSer/pThr/pTyr-binding forkhead associated (FHA) protein
LYRLVALYGRKEENLEVPEEEARLGSHPDNDIVLNVRGVSRFHAVLRRCPGGVELLDQGSKNGLIVEGSRVAWTVLTPGLRVQIGEAWLELQEVSTAGNEPARAEGVPLEALVVSLETATPDDRAVRASTSTQADALRLAYHLERMGASTPGLRDELLARLRGALGTTMLSSCEWRRREKTFVIRESSGERLSQEEEIRFQGLLREWRVGARDELRVKRSGVFLFARRGDMVIVAKFTDEALAAEGWRKDFLRFLAEYLLGNPPAIEDAKTAALRRTLAMTGGNKSETARLLRVSRQTVYNFLKRSS